MELIVSTPEQIEAVFTRVIQKHILQQPVRETQPEHLGSEEARKLLSEIWGCPVSKSKFSKDVMNHKLPVKGKAGKWLVFDRADLIRYAHSVISMPSDPVSIAIQKAAIKKSR